MTKDMIVKEFKKGELNFIIIEPDQIMGSTAVLIYQNGKGLLVDTEFSRSDGKKIVEIAESKNIDIKQIYISYSDPDFYFGANTVLENFPNAKIFATSENIKRIKQTYEAKLEVWGSTLKEDLPTKVIIPTEVSGSFEFSNTKFYIFGSDQKKQTLYIPNLKVALGGPLVSTGSHEFMADTKTTASQQQWINDLNELNDQDIDVMIPSHFGPDEKFEKKDIIFVRDYIQKFMEVMNSSSNSKEIIERMEKLYPGLNDSTLEMSAKVVTGEMDWD